MPDPKRGVVHHPTSNHNNNFFAPPSPSLNGHDTRNVDFSAQDEVNEPGARFESPEQSPATPSFTFTAFDGNSFSHGSSSPNPNSSEAYTIYPIASTSSAPSRNHTILPTILPIPLPTSSPSPKLPAAYPSKSPRGLRVDASPTSPSRSLPHCSSSSSNRFHSLLVRTIPHRFLPESIQTDSTSPFQHPKSPSLLRAHPTSRHAKKPRRFAVELKWYSLPKRWIVALVFVSIVLLFGGSTFSATTRSGNNTTTSRTEIGVGGGALGWWDRAREWQSRRKVDGHSLGGRKESLVMGDTALQATSQRTGLGDSSEFKEPRRPDEGDLRNDHHSVPSSLVSTEDQEEQAVLDAVVEEAKKIDTEQLEEQVAPIPVVAVKEVIQKVTKPKKDPSRYKRLLPLNAPSRRYLYGANFIPSSSDGETSIKPLDGSAVAVEVEVEDPEYSNKKVKVPSKKTLKRLYDVNKKVYEQEEQGWREFEWKAPKADDSLANFVAKLTPEEIKLRDWIRRLFTLPTAVGVGLSSSTNSLLPTTSSFTPSTSLLSTVPQFAGIGKQEKYDDLIRQAREGFEGKCHGSNWLDSYGKMHREMLEGKRDPKFISYHCEKGMNCGGLGDRLLGMTSAFFFGLVTQRSFLGEWQSPIPLDVVFDSPAVNWSHSSFTSSRHPVLGQQSLVDQAAELDIIHFDRLSVDSTFGSTSWNPKRGKSWTKGFEKRDIAYASKWIKFFSNRGMIYRSFSYKHLQKSIDKLGLKPTTAFACINQYLFRPKPPALELISDYTSVLALPSVFSVGIHVRTGDKSMKDSQYDKVNTVKRHSQFFRCARELGETYASPSQQVVYYLVTDSAHLKADAQRTLGTKLVTTNMVPQHVHQKAGHVDGVFSAVVEDWILSKTDMMVATQDSGFGKLASFMHGKENTTVTIFPRFNEDVNGLMGKKSHVKVDCTDPNVFTTFEELSSEWSLG